MASPYPFELEDDVMLANHRLLHIRPLRRGDDLSIRQLDGRLSPRTRYLRFFLPIPRLPESVLNLLACVDYRRRLALVGEVDAASGLEVVALGNYGAIDDRTAEIGLVVQDEWQRQGIGLALAIRMMRAAEGRGFNRFVANVLSENLSMRQFLTRFGRIVSMKTRYGVCEVSFEFMP